MNKPAPARARVVARSVIRKGLLLVLLASSLGALALYVAERKTTSPEPSAKVAQPATSGRLEAGPWQLENDNRQHLKILSEKIGNRDNLARVLERLGLPRGEIHQVAQAAGQALDLTRVKTGGEVRLWRDERTRLPVRLEYTAGLNPRLVVLKTPQGYVATLHEYTVTKRLVAAEGTIKGSLWESAVKQYGLDPTLVMAFADLFAYEVDFLTEIQPGDIFRLVYEQEYSQGLIKKHGRILGAQFETKGRKYEAYFFPGHEDETQYYDATGRSLKKMFLKSPLQYSRITSYFTHARMHPIYKIYRPHEGVDYAAPQGTPIDALGDGVITFLGWNGGYGNFIEIKHNRTYTTTYGHLSGFAKGLQKGSRVKQGQLIGYVGSTGLSTGPHLDFRVKENNTFIDPLSVKFKPTLPIDPRDRPKFLAIVAQRQTEMVSAVAAK